MMNKIKAELIRRFEENNWDEITIEMKCDNAKVYITPCTMDINHITKLEQCEYFLMSCTSMMMYGHDKLEDVVKDIMNYESNLKRNNEEIEKCRQYWLKNIKNSTDKYMDDFYSDWHKDLFGHRPRRRDIFPA